MLFASVFGFSQKDKNLNQGIYFSTDVQFAPGLKNVVADIINKDNNIPFNANFGVKIGRASCRERVSSPV
mgnify:CR=1 FL=1